MTAVGAHRAPLQFRRCAGERARFRFRVPSKLTRILSDLHYGDRASRIDRLAQLRPLIGESDALVLNGDTLDTRPGPAPAHTAACRGEVQAFVAAVGQPVTLLTGNHDPDFSQEHAVELAGGRVVVTHGDIVFEDIVPWGLDAPLIRTRIAAALAALPPAERTDLQKRFAIWRQVAAGIPQRHQSERNGLKYLVRFLADTVWPPLRVVRILRAWRIYPPLVAELARTYWPHAKFIVVGHTHRPGVWRQPGGVTVINTGSFCPPLGGSAVDVTATRVVVRRIGLEAGEFRAREVLAEFPLAER